MWMERMDRDFLVRKNVLIMGLGQFGGGVDSAIFACESGAKVTVTDLADTDTLAESLEQLGDCDIEYHLGAHRAEDFKNADVVIVNPAVGPDNKFLQIARKANRLITSQIEIFFQLCACRIVGITGANGKSTTTALTAGLLRAGIGQEGADYRDVRLSGNIGNEPLLGLLGRMDAHDVVVLELSSFQLEQLGRIQKGPEVSVITNLTPNHLDRHGSSWHLELRGQRQDHPDRRQQRGRGQLRHQRRAELGPHELHSHDRQGGPGHLR